MVNPKYIESENKCIVAKKHSNSDMIVCLSDFSDCTCLAVWINIWSNYTHIALQYNDLRD